MLISLLTVGLAAGIGTTTPDTAVTQFVANLMPDPTANTSVANAEGVASLTLSGNEIQYRLSVRNLKHVTDVAVVDGGRAIQLVSPGDTRGSTVEFHGAIDTAGPDRIPVDELRRDIQEGKAEVVVFTTNEPGGAVEGKLQPGTAGKN